MIVEFLEIVFSRHDKCKLLSDTSLALARSSPTMRYTGQSMEWIELKRSSPVQIHEPLILIQSNPADDPETESSSVQSGHNRVGIYQIPYKIDM